MGGSLLLMLQDKVIFLIWNNEFLFQPCSTIVSHIDQTYFDHRIFLKSLIPWLNISLSSSTIKVLQDMPCYYHGFSDDKP